MTLDELIKMLRAKRKVYGGDIEVYTEDNEYGEQEIFGCHEDEISELDENIRLYRKRILIIG